MKKDFTRDDYEDFLNRSDEVKSIHGTFVRTSYPETFEKNYQTFLKNTEKYRTDEVDGS